VRLLRHLRRIDRQTQFASPRRLPPGRQLLRRKTMPARHFRDDRTRRTGLRNDLTLDLVAPAAATSHPEPDVKQTTLF
jgi:hypothetical protein